MTERPVTEVRTGAWHGDALLGLRFPLGWRLRIERPKAAKPMDAVAVADAIRASVAGPNLRSLAGGASSATILVDDLTRPTPVAEILPEVVSQLEAGGIPRSAITVLVAGGAHPPASAEGVAAKVGVRIPAEICRVAHDPLAADLVRLGTAPGGTPVFVNPHVLGDRRLLVGVGCVSPHGTAGWSGGEKLVAPGACGAETVRFLHDRFRRQTGLYGGFRREVKAIAGMAGLRLSICAVVSPERGIAGLFAGEPSEAHRSAIACHMGIYAADPPGDAEVVVANAYPYDTSLQYLDRSFWPLASGGRGTSAVVLGAVPEGVGGHALGSVATSLREKAARRFRSMRPWSPRWWVESAEIIRQVAWRRRARHMFLCPGLRERELQQAFPRAEWFGDWPSLLDVLEARHGQGEVRVVLYTHAPMQFPKGRAA